MAAGAAFLATTLAGVALPDAFLTGAILDLGFVLLFIADFPRLLNGSNFDYPLFNKIVTRKGQICVLIGLSCQI